MAVKVCLDAGHYGKYNRSPAVSSYYESDMTWKLHNYLKKELEAFGIGVVTTRTNQNTDRALYERGAASKGCNLFISVHSNAVGNGVNESVDYPVSYVLLNGISTDIGLKFGKGCGISNGNCPEWKNRNTSGDKRRILWCASWCECSRNTGYYSGAFIPYKHQSNKMAFQ